MMFRSASQCKQVQWRQLTTLGERTHRGPRQCLNSSSPCHCTPHPASFYACHTCPAPRLAISLPAQVCRQAAASEGILARRTANRTHALYHASMHEIRRVDIIGAVCTLHAWTSCTRMADSATYFAGHLYARTPSHINSRLPRTSPSRAA